MNYLVLLNTIAFIILMAEVILYIGTEHTLNGCLYDINQVWCYSDLHCGTQSSTQYQNAAETN